MAINRVNTVENDDVFVQDIGKRTYGNTRDTTVTETLRAKGSPQTRARAELEPSPAAKTSASTKPTPKDQFFQNDGVARSPRPTARFAPMDDNKPTADLSSFPGFAALSYLNIDSVDQAMNMKIDNVQNIIPLRLAVPEPLTPMENTLDNTTSAAYAATGGNSNYSSSALDVMNAGGQGRVSDREASSVGSQINDHAQQVLAAQELLRNLQSGMGMPQESPSLSGGLAARRSTQAPAAPAAQSLFRRNPNEISTQPVKK